MNAKVNISKGGEKLARAIIFNNLEAELTRAEISKAELAAEIDISIGAMSNKLQGKTEFTLREMELIRDILEKVSLQELDYDYLFKRGE